MRKGGDQRVGRPQRKIVKQTWGAGAGVRRGVESEREGTWGENVLKIIGKRKKEVRVQKRESSP